MTAIRIKTASGWQDLTTEGPQGPIGDSGPAPSPGSNGQFLRTAGGSVVWQGGNILNADLASNAGIAFSKLQGYNASAGLYPYNDGVWRPIPIQYWILNGRSESYSGNFTAAQNPLNDGVGNLSFSYTTPATWPHVLMEVSFRAMVQKVDAAYHYMYGGVICTPTDAAGCPSLYQLVTQHSTVNQFEGRSVTGLFLLNPSTAYTFNAYLGGMSGGTWQYYRGPAQLGLNGKAFPIAN